MLTCCLLDLHFLLDGDLLAAHVHLVLLALPGLHLAHRDALGVRLELGPLVILPEKLVNAELCTSACRSGPLLVLLSPGLRYDM